jgi:osmotically inducible protein OsmC
VLLQLTAAGRALKSAGPGRAAAVAQRQRLRRWTNHRLTAPLHALRAAAQPTPRTALSRRASQLQPEKEDTMAIDKALYTAHATSTGGRTGTTQSSDGAIKLQLVHAQGTGRRRAAPAPTPSSCSPLGYSACFIGAMKAVAARQKIALPAEVSITADVSIGPMTGKAGAFGIAVAMAISVPGMDRAAAETLVASRARGLPLLERHPRQHRCSLDRGLIEGRYGSPVRSRNYGLGKRS